MLKNADIPAPGNNEDLGILPLSLVQELNLLLLHPPVWINPFVTRQIYKIYFTFPWLCTHRSYFKVTYISVASNIEDLLIKLLGTSEFTVLNLQDNSGILLTVIFALVFPSASLASVSLMKPILRSVLDLQSHSGRLVTT